MFVKGTAFLGRRSAIVQAFGEERWKTFLAMQDPVFRDVLPTTRIDVHKFLALQDAILKEFFNNDFNMLFAYGEKSAEWALVEGPYKTFIRDKDLARFVKEVLPFTWGVYYSEGSSTPTLEGNTVHLRVHDLPVMHPYFEYVVMGWVKRALELVTGKRVKAEPVLRAKPSAKEIYYRFVID
jgi:hypothetical protein